MNIWVDDERDPHDPMMISLWGTSKDMIWVKTYEEAIDYLLTGKVRMISLDHDLGTEKTGYDIAKWIEEAAFHGKLQPLHLEVHSQNVVGKQNIKHAFRRTKMAWREQRD